MITDSFYFPCVLFTAKLCLSFLLYKTYRANAECLKSLKEAPCFEIDHKLREEVEKNNGVIKYAIISGSVKADSGPLRSHCKDVQGVVRETVVKEHQIQWIRYLGSWKFVDDIIYSFIHVPFVLRGKTNDLFGRGMFVRVAGSSLRVSEVVDCLSTVYDKFIPHVINDNATVAFFHNGKTEGFQVVERMLCEGVTLTAVGKLIIENNELKITPPDGGFGYFLTLKTKESLIDTVYDDMRFSKNSLIVVGTVTFFLFLYISRFVFSKIKRNLEEEVHWDEQRKLRRMADKSRGLQDVNSPKCVICLDYPVEVLMLECGHAHLCFNCSEQFKRCPVCKNSIRKSVQAFWP